MPAPLPSSGPGSTSKAWLSEMVVSALSWQSSVPTHWSTWVHTAWPEDVDPPPGLDVVHIYSEVRERGYRLARTCDPSPAGPETLHLGPGYEASEALIVLTPAYLTRLPQAPLPFLVPAAGSFPDDVNGPLMPPAAMRIPALIGTGCTRDGSASMIARPVLKGRAGRHTLAESASDLTESGGVLSTQPSRIALPWVRLEYSGASEVVPRSVPAGPDLPVLSVWLQRVETVDRGHRQWRETMELLGTWASRFRSWEAVQTDQRTERVLGDLVEPSVALRADVDLFATTVLTEVPSPKDVMERLDATLSWTRRRSLQRTLSERPGIARWLRPDRPRPAPRPWR